MHELSIALEVLAIARRRSGGAEVTRVVVEVGRLAAIDPEALRFAFEAARAAHGLAGAALDIVERPGRGSCRACGAEVTLEAPFGVCACGAGDLDLVAGRELLVRELEVRSCAGPADAAATPMGSPGE